MEEYREYEHQAQQRWRWRSPGSLFVFVFVFVKTRLQKYPFHQVTLCRDLYMLWEAMMATAGNVFPVWR